MKISTGDLVKLQIVNKSITTGKMYLSDRFGIIIEIKDADNKSNMKNIYVSFESGCEWHYCSALKVV